MKRSALLGGEIEYALHVQAETANDFETAEFLADVLGTPVGVGAATVRCADCNQCFDVFGHIQFGEHVAGIETAEGMG